MEEYGVDDDIEQCKAPHASCNTKIESKHV
jgi:hypothetical protein